MQQATMTRAIDGHAFRRIDGKIQNMRAVGGVKSGRVYSVSDDGIIVVQEGGMSDVHYWALKNYPKEAVADKHIEVAAVKSGVYNWRETPLQLWDYGILLTPEEEKQKRDDAEAAQMKIQQQRIEVARMKAFIANSNAVVRLQLQATNGAAWAQCSLGLHYLKGEGCETNREQAIYWLQKAALQGDLEASNKLSGLK